MLGGSEILKEHSFVPRRGNVEAVPPLWMLDIFSIATGVRLISVPTFTSLRRSKHPFTPCVRVSIGFAIHKSELLKVRQIFDEMIRANFGELSFLRMFKRFIKSHILSRPVRSDTVLVWTIDPSIALRAILNTRGHIGLRKSLGPNRFTSPKLDSFSGLPVNHSLDMLGLILPSF